MQSASHVDVPREKKTQEMELYKETLESENTDEQQGNKYH